MESGPSRMYMQQAPAFEARQRMITDLGPSTEDSPPVFTPPDIEGLKALKKRVVENLPTKCVHCEADMLPEYCTELKDGTVMAYCKKRGACGRSLVLFAGVEMIRPVYRKICPFKAADSAPARTGMPDPVSRLPEQQEQLPQEMQVSQQMQVPQQMLLPQPSLWAPQSQIPQQMQMQMQMQQDMLQQDDVSNVQRPLNRYNLAELFARGEIDVYELHGIKKPPRPDEICQRCERPYSEHEHANCDKHGWVHDHDELLELPADWPTYDHGSHTWRPRSTSSIWNMFSR